MRDEWKWLRIVPSGWLCYLLSQKYLFIRCFLQNSPTFKSFMKFLCPQSEFNVQAIDG